MKTKKAIAISIVFLLIAAVLFVGGMSLIGWNFARLDSNTYVEKVYNIPADAEPIKAIDVDSWHGVVVTTGEKFTLKYYDTDESTSEVSLKNGKLVLNQRRTRKWWNFFNFSTKKVEITIPENVDLEIEAANLELRAEGVSLGELNIDSVNTDIYSTDCTGKNLNVKSTNVHIDIKDSTFDTIYVNGVNNYAELINCTLNKFTQNGINDDLRFNENKIESVYVDSVNLNMKATIFTANLLKIDSTNMTVKVTLSGAKSEYNISGDTLNGKLPPAQIGTDPNKIIRIDGVNFSGFINFATE